MFACHFIDTYPDFLRYWSEVQHRPLDEQIEGWENIYMRQYPELLAKQKEDYSSQNIDWRQIAREKVFPHLTSRLSAMHEAHKNLLEAGMPLYSRAQIVLDYKADMIFVLYVGIGCGAGWATSFQDLPAILFGLENIAECGWSNRQAISGLIAHELGHLTHYYWRNKSGKSNGSGPWWQLYAEGFAQRCESLIVGHDSFHQTIKDKNWCDWCQNHKGLLASEFIKTIDAGKPVSAFFGSWFDIQGRTETGYFLGQELVRTLEKDSSLKEIALIDNAENNLKPILEKMI